ncbi:pyruvate, phosphate dikinase [Paenibacillus sp. 481]|uniref:pyruvate, phosphate dikinase n=1 Tax=Paenibacillus sp. 481 TaxID=2835869 RepID=UPI001E55A2A5|nr:pyruvate, phosphate dikinase [Paenibacillus sp. 481]UHA74821.1 pyruvate, phosphate dikinase [Paenibacillus sp. 481]
MSKRIYHFHEGQVALKPLLGGKGANLAEMTGLGLPIPPGFTITTAACLAYEEAGQILPLGLMEEVQQALFLLEQRKQLKLGDRHNPLLVSVRSGAVASMPGMMDTILNLGLNDETVEGLAILTQDERFAYDCYRRFLHMFSTVVLYIPTVLFEDMVHLMKQERGFVEDHDVTADGWKEVCQSFKQAILERTGDSFPQQVEQQLQMAIEAVFRSWHNPRAQVFRRTYGIPDAQGTAVNIQAMVFGNWGEDSGTGVLFTRNPSTGEKMIYGEYLANAQGEDVVAGVRTPLSISHLDAEMPYIYEQLVDTALKLEQHYKDMQDIEFTVEQGQLYLLQTREGKRTAQAAVKIAVDLVREGVISPEEAVERMEPMHMDQLLHRSIRHGEALTVLAQGLPASPGAASGQVVFDADTAVQWKSEGRSVLLVSTETTPDDIHGVIAAAGVLTSRGGMTSHAAVVARGMGKPCVCGCATLVIDAQSGTLRLGNVTVREGEALTIDGATGQVILGTVELQEPQVTAELAELLRMADSIRELQVYANADTPEDAAKAREFGAQGIGLCRTEHMFMSPERLPVVQAMILAESDVERAAALRRILPMQQADFEGIFAAMDGLPVTIRLLDPPLHEFLPSLYDLKDQLHQVEAGLSTGIERERLTHVLRKVESLHETNPMLGLRGCRLGLLFPDIYDMQIEAVFLAARASIHRGVAVLPDIMVPLVGHVNELSRLRKRIDECAERVLGVERLLCPYRVGTMIEVPRAALTAGEIAQHAEFFSFGTNDLTQMTFGYSRDDAEGKFLAQYLETGILPVNPFQVLDQDGVGQLIELAAARGKAMNANLKTGICGEHGGDSKSIAFCHAIGLDYVSCSPYRIPNARIAAAQAVLQHRKQHMQASLSQQAERMSKRKVEAI